MCDLATAALVVSAGGALMQQQQQAAAVSANRSSVDQANAQRIAAQRQEQARQDELSRRRREVAAGTTQQATPQAMTQAEDAATAERFVAATAPMPTMETVDARFTPAGSNPAVIGDSAMQLSKSLGEARRRLRGQSFLGGAGDATGAFGRRLVADNSQIASIDSMGRGSLGAYGVEADVRPTQVAADTTLGDALAAAGALGAGYLGRRQGVSDAKEGRMPTGIWG